MILILRIFVGWAPGSEDVVVDELPVHRVRAEKPVRLEEGRELHSVDCSNREGPPSIPRCYTCIKMSVVSVERSSLELTTGNNRLLRYEGS